MDRYTVFTLAIILGIFIGAIFHERDMYHEYKYTGKLEQTSWVTDWDFQREEQ